ncbi:MAG: competence/damage-inducible protein A [Gemmatimonadota bacterium]|nr:competence/damage-inducible protein A [Gemmatimonadota bacterium]
MNNSPVIEIYSIGTELIMGRIQDTNAHWLAQQIVQLGGSLRQITIVPDEIGEIIAAVGSGIDRGTGIIVMTGGLGPTPDDMTVEAISSILGTKPAVHGPTLENFMARRNITDPAEATKPMIKMATVPHDADVFQNHVGWAPCIRVSKGDSTLFILPGPPREMEALFNGCVAEYISSSYQTKSAVLRVMINMFESEVSPLLETVMENYPTTYLKGYVAMRQSMDHDLPVDIVATGENAADAQLILNAAVELLSNLVSEKGKRMELYDE